MCENLLSVWDGRTEVLEQSGGVMEDNGGGTVEALVEAMAMRKEASSAGPLNPERVSPQQDDDEEEDTQFEQVLITLS